jgi:hypothetical protein
MAAAPNKGLFFEIKGVKIAYGVLNAGDFGDILVLAIGKGVGSNDYSWSSQFQLDDLIYNRAPTDAEILAFCEKSLAEANRILAREFPIGGVVNPSTPKEKIEAWVMGLRFDASTNQIVKK